MERHQTMGGPHEMHGGPAVVELVAHHLGDGQGRQRVVQSLLQALRQGRAGHHAVVEQGLDLAIGGPPQPGHGRFIQPQGREFLEQGGRGPAIGVEADGHRHELAGDGPVGRPRGHRRDMDGKPPGRGEGGRLGGVRGQTLGAQPLEQALGKGLTEPQQRLGRQLLDQEFHQERGQGRILRAHAAAFRESCARAASAHSRGAMGKPRRARDST